MAQLCKYEYNRIKSSYMKIKLRVPQGSVLEPLFFLILIKDIPLILNLLWKLFADDTTLYKFWDDINILILKINPSIVPY